MQFKYKAEYEKNRGKMLGTDETPEMIRSKELKPITSKQAYEEKAKKDLPKTNVGAGQRMFLIHQKAHL